MPLLWIREAFSSLLSWLGLGNHIWDCVQVENTRKQRLYITHSSPRPCNFIRAPRVHPQGPSPSEAKDPSSRVSMPSHRVIDSSNFCVGVLWESLNVMTPKSQGRRTLLGPCSPPYQGPQCLGCTLQGLQRTPNLPSALESCNPARGNGSQMNIIHTYKGREFCHRDEPWGHLAKGSKPVTKGQTLYDPISVRSLEESDS